MSFKIVLHQVPKTGNSKTIKLSGAILHVSNSPLDLSTLDLFAMHHANAEPQERAFKVYLTGEEIPDTANHVSTIVTEYNGIVYHLFDVSNVPMRELYQ